MNISDFKHHSQLSLDFNLSRPLKLTGLEIAILTLLESMDLSCFEGENECRRAGRPARLDAYEMMVLILYSRAHGCCSSRDMEALCRRDLFIYSVLDG